MGIWLQAESRKYSWSEMEGQYNEIIIEFYLTLSRNDCRLRKDKGESILVPLSTPSFLAINAERERVSTIKILQANTMDLDEDSFQTCDDSFDINYINMSQFSHPRLIQFNPYLAQFDQGRRQAIVGRFQAKLWRGVDVDQIVADLESMLAPILIPVAVVAQHQEQEEKQEHREEQEEQVEKQEKQEVDTSSHWASMLIEDPIVTCHHSGKKEEEKPLTIEMPHPLQPIPPKASPRTIKYLLHLADIPGAARIAGLAGCLLNRQRQGLPPQVPGDPRIDPSVGQAQQSLQSLFFPRSLLSFERVRRSELDSAGSNSIISSSAECILGELDHFEVVLQSGLPEKEKENERVVEECGGKEVSSSGRSDSPRN